MPATAPISDCAAAPEREAFFTALVHDHARFLYAVAFTVLRHPQDAEDAVQATLLKLFRSPSWTAIENPRAFLARATWRTALDIATARRSSNTAPAHASANSSQTDPQDLLQTIPALNPSPEIQATHGDLAGHLQRFIAELPSDLRDPLLLSALDGMTSREIASILNIPDATVRTRIHRARAALRTRFEALNQARPQPQPRPETKPIRDPALPEPSSPRPPPAAPTFPARS